MQLVEVTENLIDLVWRDKTPEQVQPIIIHDREYVSKTTPQKFEEAYSKVSADVPDMLMAKLDQIAWILNLRGSDIHFNPVFKAFLLLTKSENSYTGKLFVEEAKITNQVREYLQENGVSIFPYLDIYTYTFSNKVLLVMNEVNCRLFQRIPKNL